MDEQMIPDKAHGVFRSTPVLAKKVRLHAQQWVGDPNVLLATLEFIPTLRFDPSWFKENRFIFFLPLLEFLHARCECLTSKVL